MKGNLTKHAYLSKRCMAVIVSALIATSLSGCSLIPKEEAVMAPPLVRSSDVKISTEKVKLGSIADVISISGFLVPTNMYLCAFENRGGYLTNLYFENGAKVKKGDVLAEIDSDSLKTRLKQEEIKYKKMKMRYDSIANNPQSSDMEKENAALDLELEALELNNIKEELSKCTLIAPASGMITFKAKAAIGDMVRTGSPIYIISNDDDFLVEIASENLSKLKVGMDAYAVAGDKKLTGKVVSIDEGNPMSQFLQGPQSSKENTHTATIKLDSLPQPARMGQQLAVTINIDQKENVLIVPKTAIKYFESTPYVKVIQDDNKIEKFVKLGIDNGNEVEILEGVSEGEEVMTN